jgi:hypothetical protein
MGFGQYSAHQAEHKQQRVQQFSARAFKMCPHYPYITNCSRLARQLSSNAIAKLTGWLTTAHTSETKLLKWVHKQ